MLRDLLPFPTSAGDEILIDAPGVSSDEHTTATADTFDDIFGSVPASSGLPTDHAPDGDGASAGSVLPDAVVRTAFDDRSDVPRLRSTHVTNGYREGIANSKETYMQEGFDEGYSLGAELGLRAGWCLGALHGMVQAVAARASNAASDEGSSIEALEMHQCLQEAEKELRVQSLVDREYFGQDGIWLYAVEASHGGGKLDGGREGEEPDVTFAYVAAAHPIIKKWNKKIHSISRSLGMTLR